MKNNHLVFFLILLVTMVGTTVYASEVYQDQVISGLVNEDYNEMEMADITCADIGITSTLKYGKKNTQVSILQDVLINSGYYEGDSTGIFDTATKNAVKMMQQAVGVKADGIVGPMTREAMREMCVDFVVGS